MRTYVTKPKEIKRNWHLLDVEGKVLGRLATQAAGLLMGKNKPCFVRNVDCGDWVVVINAVKVKVTGRKEKQKIYFRHSGYPGGLKAIPLERMRREHPERIFEHAVWGMLPKNKLRDKMMARLKIFTGEEHPYEDKINAKN